MGTVLPRCCRVVFRDPEGKGNSVAARVAEVAVKQHPCLIVFRARVPSYHFFGYCGKTRLEPHRVCRRLWRVLTLTEGEYRTSLPSS